MCDTVVSDSFEKIFVAPAYEGHSFLAKIAFPWQDASQNMVGLTERRFPLIAFLQNPQKSTDSFIVNYMHIMGQQIEIEDYLQEQCRYLSRSFAGFVKDEMFIENREGSPIGFLSYAYTTPSHDMHALFFFTSFDEKYRIHGVYNTAEMDWSSNRELFLQSVRACKVILSSQLPKLTA